MSRFFNNHFLLSDAKSVSMTFEMFTLKDIRKVNHKITEYDNNFEPSEWNIEFIMMNGERHWLSPEEAINFNRKVVAWYSNIHGWAEHNTKWAWTANHEECKFPLELLEEP